MLSTQPANFLPFAPLSTLHTSARGAARLCRLTSEALRDFFIPAIIYYIRIPPLSPAGKVYVETFPDFLATAPNKLSGPSGYGV